MIVLLKYIEKWSYHAIQTQQRHLRKLCWAH